MDWLTFFSKIIDSAIWPLVAIIAVTILRKPLSSLIPLLRKLKYKDFEVEFSKEVSELRPIVKKEIPLPSAPRPLAEKPETIVAKLYKLADLSPRSVVMEAWRDVESSAVEAAQRKQLDITKTPHKMFLSLCRFLGVRSKYMKQGVTEGARRATGVTPCRWPLDRGRRMV